jgi:uncharacterized membrane protein HdeD (DUF308 family)
VPFTACPKCKPELRNDRGSRIWNVASRFRSAAQRSWWKLILSGLLAFAFGIAAVLLPFNIMFRRILDVIFGMAKPLSGSMTAVAVMLALVALVVGDGLINLLGAGVMDKRAARIRGIVGVAVALAAVFWPGLTAFVAVELIGLWAVLIGVLELVFARDSAKDRALRLVAAIASIALGVGMMRWAFAGGRETPGPNPRGMGDALQPRATSFKSWTGDS